MSGNGARYSWGGDEHLFVEVSEEMSLEAYFKATAIVEALNERRPDGVIDICPANAAYQVRFNPDELEPEKLEKLAREVEEEVGDAHSFELDTRIVEIPVLYDDPWTNETLMKFRDNHQEPDSTDLEYAAKINDFEDKAAFIEAHHKAPWLASMVGFVAGLPFLFQLVPRERQLEVPKYVTPRTDTPPLTVGHGGCFGCIYSVRGAGGYQMFGITPLPIYDPKQEGPDFEDFVCFFEPGDIVKFEPIDRDRYDELVEEVEAGKATIKQKPVSFEYTDFADDPDAFNEAAAGGAPWRLRSSRKACPPPFRTADARATTTSACRRRARSTSSRWSPPTCWSATHRARPGWSARTWVRSSSSARTRPSPYAAPRSRPRSTTRRASRGRRSRSRKATSCRSGTSRRALARTSRCPAGSTCPRFWAAGRRMRSARWAGSTAARSRRATSCRLAATVTRLRKVARCPRTCAPTCPRRSRSASSWACTTTC